jgi:hypothetical protein
LSSHENGGYGSHGVKAAFGYLHVPRCKRL